MNAPQKETGLLKSSPVCVVLAHDLAQVCNGSGCVLIKLRFSGTLRQIAPDGNILADLTAHGDERLHDHIAVITYFLQHLADFLPVKTTAGAGAAAIGLTHVEVAQQGTGLADGLNNGISSMFMWKVSSINLTLGLSTALT